MMSADALLEHHGYHNRSRFSRNQHDVTLASSHLDSNMVTVTTYNRPSKLYIVLVDSSNTNSMPSSSIDSREKARDEKALAMHCLGLLSNCRAVGLITAVSNVNTICNGCDVYTMNLFNWAYIHCPTFEPKKSELCLQDFGINIATYTVQHKELMLEDDSATAESKGNSSLVFVVNSLTPKHKEILRLLCNYVDTEIAKQKELSGSSKNVGNISMPWALFLNSCKENLIVKKDADLRVLLRELIAHNLVVNSIDASNDMITVKLTYSTAIMLPLL